MFAQFSSQCSYVRRKVLPANSVTSRDAVIVNFENAPVQRYRKHELWKVEKARKEFRQRDATAAANSSSQAA